MDMITKTQSYGYYTLKRVQSSKKYNKLFYDIWILNTNSKNSDQLAEFQAKSIEAYTNGDKTICCMWQDGL